MIILCWNINISHILLELPGLQVWPVFYRKWGSTTGKISKILLNLACSTCRNRLVTWNFSKTTGLVKIDLASLYTTNIFFVVTMGTCLPLGWVHYLNQLFQELIATQCFKIFPNRCFIAFDLNSNPFKTKTCFFLHSQTHSHIQSLTVFVHSLTFVWTNLIRINKLNWIWIMLSSSTHTSLGLS